jgi:hypothetical protein
LDPYSQLAQVQDWNYAAQAYTIPRYYGSKTISATYNDYTQGDTSYGKSAAIDKIKSQYGYLVDMYSSSFQLPGRVNAQIKYMLDNNQNVLDLTKANKNIFTTQNVFKSGENVNISLFNYDPNSNMAQYLTDNQTVNLYEGGFRYSPILFNVSGALSIGYYALTASVTTTSTVTTPSYTTLTSGSFNYWASDTLGTNSPGVQNQSGLWSSYAGFLRMPVTFSAHGNNIGSSNKQTTVYYSIFNTSLYADDMNYFYSTFFTVPINTSAPWKFQQTIPESYSGSIGVPTPNGGTAWLPTHNYSSSILIEEEYNPSGGTTTTTSYSSSIIDNDSRWIVSSSISGEHVIRLSATQSLYYGGFTFSSASSGLETPISNFSLSQMDLVRLYNLTSSWGSYNESEYRIKNVYSGNRDPLGAFSLDGTSNTYYFITLDRNINPNETAANTIPGFISRYITLKRSPDETNLIFAFSGSSNITDDGLVFPKYIDPVARENSGNVVKALKQQNLI